MDCKTARLLLNFVRPGRAEIVSDRSVELEADDAAELAGHLADCPEVPLSSAAERQIDDHLGRAIRDVPVPAGLRDRLVGELASQRRSWYRRQLIRSAGSLAAACILIVAGWYFWPRPPVHLDLAARHELTNNLPTSAQEVVEHFKKQGVAVQLPADFSFNYDFLTYCNLGDLQGQRVPLLIFQNGPAFLRVYILDGQRFDLQSIAGTLHSGRVTIELRIPAEGRFGWLFEYLGNPENFKARDSLPAT